MDLMVWDITMYTEDEDGTIIKYSYEGDCSPICDIISIDDCQLIKETK